MAEVSLVKLPSGNCHLFSGTANADDKASDHAKHIYESPYLKSPRIHGTQQLVDGENVIPVAIKVRIINGLAGLGISKIFTCP